MANQTKYVDTVDGNDSNSGNSPGSGNAWKTIEKAVDTISGGGNIIWVKANGDYAENITITVSGDTTNGFNRLEGYGTSTGDNIPFTINGTSGDNIDIAASYWHIKNAICANASGHALHVASGGRIVLNRCSFRNSGTSLLQLDSGRILIYNCDGFGSAANAEVIDADGATHLIISRSSFELDQGDTTSQTCILLGSSAVFHQSEFFNVKTSMPAIASGGTNEQLLMFECSLHGASNHAIIETDVGGYKVIAINNVFYNGDNVANTTAGSAADVFGHFSHNALFNITTDYGTWFAALNDVAGSSSSPFKELASLGLIPHSIDGAALVAAGHDWGAGPTKSADSASLNIGAYQRVSGGALLRVMLEKLYAGDN